jgi:hypothetical protein
MEQELGPANLIDLQIVLHNESLEGWNPVRKKRHGILIAFKGDSVGAPAD